MGRGSCSLHSDGIFSESLATCKPSGRDSCFLISCPGPVSCRLSHKLGAAPWRSRAIGLSPLREAESSQNHGGSPLNNPQTGGQQLSIAMPELYVVGRCASRLEPEGFADRERDGFSFGLTNLLGGRATPIPPMQQFVGDLMHQRGKL